MSTKEIINEIEKINDINKLKTIMSVLVVHMDKIRSPRNNVKTYESEDNLNLNNMVGR